MNKRKERHIEKLVENLEGIDVDAHAAWQASLQLQAGLSDRHIDTKNKLIKLKDKNGNHTANPAEQVQIQGDFFSKQIFGRHTPFNLNAINNLTSVPTNNAIAAPITLISLHI